MLSLTPWKKSLSPADESRVLPLSLFAADVDPLFAQLVNGFFGERDGFLADPVRVEVRETDEAYVVRAEVPGIEPEALDLQLTGDLLVLSGEKQDERKDEKAGNDYSRIGHRSA